MNNITKSITVLGLVFTSHAAMAAPQFFTGGGTTADAMAAYTNWTNSVASFSTDTMDGLGTNLTTNGGLEFSALGVTGLSSTTINTGITSGTALQIYRNGGDGAFNMNLSSPADSFGLFAYDSDGGTITFDVTYLSGSTDTFVLNTAAGSGQQDFVGVSGFSEAVVSMVVRDSDPGGIAYVDNFVYGLTANAVVPPVYQVPETSSLALIGLGLAGIGLQRRRTRKAQ